MGFVGRLNFPRLPTPARVYVHEAGFSDVYCCLKDAQAYALERFNRNEKQLKDHAFFLGVMWGNGEVAIMDCKGLLLDGASWPGNPEKPTWTYSGGVFRPEFCPCGDADIVFGREEEFRRATRDLRDYAENLPPLDHIRAGETLVWPHDGYRDS